MYWMEWWRRHTSSAPQRGQYPGSAASAGRDSKLQISQETSPASAAVSGTALIVLPSIEHFHHKVHEDHEVLLGDYKTNLLIPFLST